MKILEDEMPICDEVDLNTIETGYLMGRNNNYDNTVLDDIIEFLSRGTNEDEKKIFCVFCQYLSKKFMESNVLELSQFILYNIDELIVPFVKRYFELNFDDLVQMTIILTTDQIHKFNSRFSSVQEVERNVYNIIYKNFDFVAKQRSMSAEQYTEGCNNIAKLIFDMLQFKRVTLTQEYTKNEIKKSFDSYIYYITEK